MHHIHHTSIYNCHCPLCGLQHFSIYLRCQSCRTYSAASSNTNLFSLFLTSAFRSSDGGCMGPTRLSWTCDSTQPIMTNTFRSGSVMHPDRCCDFTVL